MQTMLLLRRAAATTALVATVLAPSLASAATYVSPYDLTVATVPLRVMPGSQYDSITVGDTSLTVTLSAGQAFIIRALGGNPRSLENSAGLPACKVISTRDNQMVLNGPLTVTITPSTSACSTSDYSNDKTPFISVVSPNGGQTVKSGDSVQIFWSNSGTATPAVRLALSVDGGNTWPTVLADGIINGGFYNWTVPSMPSAAQARLRIDGLDQGRVVAFDISDNNFSIEGTSPEVAPTPVVPAGETSSVHPPYSPEAATAAATTIDVDRGFTSVGLPSGTTTCAAGTRIKGASSTAVYYCGADGKRHAFPNQRIHDSWYQGFAGVVTLSDTQLASVQLGKSVTYRPGVRLVKITTDPKVYAVAANGTLRWVQDEWSAKRLYGDNWNKMVDDVPDSFFTDYSVGEPVPAN